MAVFLLLLGPACEDSNTKRLQDFQARQASSKERRDSIREAFRYLPQLMRMDRKAALREIRYQLNVWSQSVVTPPEWKPAGMLESVSPELRTISFSKRMSKLEFDEPECEFLLQCQMLKDVGKWVLDLPYGDKLFSKWLEQQKSVMPADDWLRLETAMKLFDWTVCNVAIEGQAKDVERLVTNSELPVNDTGANYRQLPWQTMMFGHGETWQRARVFTQLAFMQGIDCVVLALPSETGATENASLRLWCVGVPIGKELYLFEPQWGLPFPSQSSDGVATLREAKENPAVMRRAKLPGRFEYPVEQKDLSRLIALADVEPFTVGRTMYTLERSLTGENRLRISLDADEFEKKLGEIDPQLSVRLWNVPWLAHVYNQSVRERLDEKSPFSMSYIERFGAYILDTGISRARTLHFKGQFESTVEAAGALRTYMDIRIDEQTLKELEYDREIQKLLHITKGVNEPLENFQGRIQQAQLYYRRSKYDVAAFLAMANLSLNKPETTIDWAKRRLINLPGTEAWHAHAHYLLGRSNELLGNTEAAIEEYKFEKSPQAAGNRIRNRKLEVASP
jgi:tetratricopeptide (TPR) repeat protein